MRVDVLFSASPADENDGGRDENSFDVGKFQFSQVSSRWGDERMLRVGGHDAHSPDVIVCHSSVFKFDLLRMLRFVLWARKRAPWIIFVLLLSKTEVSEMGRLPKQLREHFSRYFCDIRDSFSIDAVVQFISEKFDLIEELMTKKRKQHFKTTVVSRRLIDNAIHHHSEQNVEYDFALSFAGAQRAEARDIASILSGRGCKVFFDEYETTRIVGSNLTEFLHEIYANKSSYCVLLASKAYVEGPWTRHERRAALDMAIKTVDRSYILIVRFDDADLPGISASVAYLSWQDDALTIAKTLYEKLVLDMLT